MTGTHAKAVSVAAPCRKRPPGSFGARSGSTLSGFLAPVAKHTPRNPSRLCSDFADGQQTSQLYTPHGPSEGSPR
jgi:hypothetical protein